MKTIKKFFACIAVVAVLATSPLVFNKTGEIASDTVTIQGDPGGGVGHTTSK